MEEQSVCNCLGCQAHQKINQLQRIVFEQEKKIEALHGPVEPNAEWPRRDFIDIGPECFSNGDVICYKGENYYRACDKFVYQRPDGGNSFCVKRVGHQDEHQSYDGVKRG